MLELSAQSCPQPRPSEQEQLQPGPICLLSLPQPREQLGPICFPALGQIKQRKDQASFDLRWLQHLAAPCTHLLPILAI